MGAEQAQTFDELITLVHDGLVCLSGHDGTIDGDTFQGLYFRDLRLLSRLEIASPRVALLSSQRDGARRSDQVFAAATDEHGTPTALLRRQRTVGAALVERYELEVYAGELRGVELSVRLESDFRPALKGADRPPAVEYRVSADGLEAERGRFGVRIEVDGPPPHVEGGTLSWRIDAAAGDRFEVSVIARPCEAGAPFTERPRDPQVSSLRVRAGSPAWSRSIASAAEDVAALRMRVPQLDVSYIAAGAPWFMALFGRDTLITAWESLIAGSDIALDTLDALARYQGQDHDAQTGEQPGRILHELRIGGVDLFGIEAGRPYYGTVDASPLFVMLLAEAYRWGADPQRVRALVPAARAALEWCTTHGDVDGDGWVEYAADQRALVNQGWKDSGDAMIHADGSVAIGPIALSEVQAYVWAAHQDLARLEEDFGSVEAAAGLRRRADVLRRCFHETFWLPDKGLVAMALDRDKQPLAVASSNMGHVLWTGILEHDVGRAVADRLAGDDLLSRWGIRTLAASERAYNPLGYHLGSIWPHDAAIGAAGLRRYGRGDAALRTADGLLAAGEHFGWRLPELFGGLTGDLLRPVPYPVACSPQAWSAAAPLLLLRTVLGLDPDVPAGTMAVSPALADDAELEIREVPLGDGRARIRARGATVVVDAPAGIRVTQAKETA